VGSHGFILSSGSNILQAQVHKVPVGKCKGCSYGAQSLDDAAWAKVVEIVNDPSELAKKILSRQTKDPTEENRKNINKKLAEINKHIDHFQRQLADLMKTGELDRETREFLTSELRRLNDDKHQWTTQLSKVGETHDKWKKVHKKLDELLRECEKMRENMNDSNYIPSYKTKRDFIEYLGITVTVWRPEHRPRFKVECNPPDITTLIASITS
jgi:DNA repair exonuclease SbcCD ATPase subunit